MMVRLAKGEVDRARQAAAQARRHPVPAERRRLRARQVPRPRRHDRSLAGLRRVRPAHRALRRRGRCARDHQPAHRRGHSQRSTSCSSTRPSTSSRRRSASSEAIDGIEQELDERLERVQERGQAARSPAARGPHALRPRHDARGRLLLRASRTTPAGSRGRHAGRAAVHAASTSSPTISCCIVDESHVTLPQVRGMFAGDRSRKETLVEHGFRLPSALDNRPLQVRRVGEADQAGALHVGHAGAVRTGEDAAAKWSSR